MSDNFGVYAGNNVYDILAFEKWVGREVDSVAVHTGRASWTDWNGSISWAIKNFSSLDRDVTLSIPMFANEGNLVDAADGDYNGHYLAAAKKLLAAYGDQEVIYVRVGEEFNGGWFPWAAKGQEAAYVDAFREFVTTFRGVSDKFKFEWNVANGEAGMDVAKAYPGDAYVDVIGMDFYYNTAWDNPDPALAWNSMVTRKYGLQWLEDFAAAHGKPTAYSEWGVNSDDAGAFIAKAQAWFASHNVLYQNYWNTDSAFQGKLSSDQYPLTADAFQAAFGVASSTPTTPTTPIPTDTTNLGAAAAGDNIYVAKSSASIFVEGLNAGQDTVKSAFSYTLGANVEKLTLTGGAAVNGTGNALDNYIVGNKSANELRGGDGADTLIGGGGADKLYGGAGDDSYTIVFGSELVVETAGQGIDTVYSPSSYTLAANVENLVLTSGRSAGFGNELNNQITGTTAANRLEGRVGADTLNGNSGDDTLVGGRGDDHLIGGAGADRFVLGKLEGDDVIQDFGVGGRDMLDLSSFAVGGKISATLSASGSDTLVSFKSGESVLLLGVHVNELQSVSGGFIHI
ncbi:glycosyl hydrolase [Phenylobacterium sp. LjRoot225]|uniref:glycosyl hydrolase n=1 Tax=Phenylobacterium sp. LjRoot225 TaxID=3342285 RepID=UPI003ECC8E82